LWVGDWGRAQSGTCGAAAGACACIRYKPTPGNAKSKIKPSAILNAEVPNGVSIAWNFIREGIEAGLEIF
jgi:hypothetical protein